MPQRRVARRNPKAQPNLDAATIEALITQPIAEALADRNVDSEQGRGTR